MTINLDTAPYHDDYTDEKGYYKILFQPGRAVQARELTQLQTALQKQVERLGTHVFQDGARVVNGEFGYTNTLGSIKLVTTHNSIAVDDYIDTLIDVEVVGASSGVKGTIVAYSPSATNAGGIIDPPTLFVLYDRTGDDAESYTFSPDEELYSPSAQVYGYDTSEPFAKIAPAIQEPINSCASASIDEGIYFAKGHFVYLPAQRIVLEKYTNTPSVRVGLQIIESVVTATEDDSLLDNATGTPNFAARGADRYSIALNLVALDLLSEDDPDFIELQRVSEGRLISKVDKSGYAELEKNLARRTYDHAGDFIVEPFRLKMRESLDDGNNDGVYATGSYTDDRGLLASEDLMAFQISSGKAYVRGFEVTTTAPAFIDVDKPKVFNSKENAVTSVEVGNYVQVNNVSGLPDISGSGVGTPFGEISLYSDLARTNKIGVARARAIEYNDSDPAAGGVITNETFKLFLFDIKTFAEIDTVANHGFIAGEYVRDSVTGSTGYVNSASTGTKLYITSASGPFLPNSTLTGTTGTAAVCSVVTTHDFSAVRSIDSTSAGFSCDTVLSAAGVASLKEQNKNLLVKKLAKDYLKTVDNTELTVRRLFSHSVTNAGTITLDADAGGNAGGTFRAGSNINYQITEVGTGTVFDINQTGVNVSGSQVELTNPGFAAGNDYKIVAVVDISPGSVKQKTNSHKKVAVDGTGASGIYGTRANDAEISLGFTDAWRVLAVYDSLTPGVGATVPTMVVNNSTDISKAKTIIGADSGAAGIVLSVSPGPGTSKTVEFVYTSGTFVAGEQVNSDTDTSTIVSVNHGSTDIKSNYKLDSGQRDNFYDISRLVLKPKTPTPRGDLLVVFNHFSHDSGDYFSVGSYQTSKFDSAGNFIPGYVAYEDIPYYSSTRIDPDTRDPDGQFDLRNCVDFRPTISSIAVHDADGTTAYDSTDPNEDNIIYRVVDNTFDFEARQYNLTSQDGSSITSCILDNSNFEYDYSYYLGRKDALFVSTNGEFIYTQGTSAENPVKPADIDNTMRLADITLLPYAMNITRDVRVTSYKAKRYTMKDIGRLEDRLSNVEYYTSLSLLEKSVESLQIKDVNGYDRFKSGFVVDNFSSHKIGDVRNQDYKCSIDTTTRTLRPMYKMKNVELQESLELDTARLAQNYQVTGKVATLPYAEVTTIKQPYATRIENLNPMLSVTWRGYLELDPSSDEWFETEKLPSVTLNVEGNYDTVVAENANAIGTIWDAATTTWTGEIVDSNTSEEFNNNGDVISRTIVETELGLVSRSGVTTTINEKFDVVSDGEKVISNSLIPFIREKAIKFTAHGMKPHTKVYPFFDNRNVSRYCQPNGGTLSAPAVDIIEETIDTNTTNWTSISKAIVYYNYGDINNAMRAWIEYRSDEDTDDEWVRRSDIQDLSTSKDQVEFTITGAIRNRDGEGQIRVQFERDDESAERPRRRRSFRFGRSRRRERDNDESTELDVSQIEFYDQNGNLLPNDTNVSLDSFENIENPERSFAVSNILNREKRHRTRHSRMKDRRRARIGWRLHGGRIDDDNRKSRRRRRISAENLNTTELVTDGLGKVSGIFYLPDPNAAGAPAFETGTRQFRLSADPSNGREPETFAQSNYFAKGILETRQETFISTRNAEVIVNNVSQLTETTRTNSNTTAIDPPVVIQPEPAAPTAVATPVLPVFNWTGWSWGLGTFFNWIDPLAQSFQVVTRGGEFITSIDIFFATKDKNIPVTLQFREMENGVPTNKVIPGTSITLLPEFVNTSQDASAATTFKFENPIYLKESTEVAIVLLTESQEYHAWISKLGEEEINGTRYVSKQPHLGVLFKSQNNSTWTAYDYEDLKFDLKRAEFSITQPGTLTLTNYPLADIILGSNPIETFAGSNVLKVYHNDHHMYSDSYSVLIDGVSSGVTALLSADVNIGATSIIVDSDISGSTTNTYKITDEATGLSEVVTASSASATTITLTSGLQNYYYAGAVVELHEIQGIALTEINKTHSIVGYGMDYYFIEIASVMTDSEFIGGSDVSASENALADSFQLMVPTIQLPNTSATASVQMITASALGGSQVAGITKDLGTITPTKRYDNSVPFMITSDTDSAKVTFTLRSSVSNLSPVIDMDRKSITTYANRLDNVTSRFDVDYTDDGGNTWLTDTYRPATSPDQDSAEAIYMTKTIQLSNPANSIKVFYDAVRNNSANIELMYKVLRADDSTTMDDTNWTYFNGDGSPDTFIPVVPNRSEFLEYEHTVDDLPEFISFAIKIRMTGTNSCEVPLIKNLRALALAL